MGSNFYLATDQKSKPTPRFFGFLPDEFLRSCLCIEQAPPIMSSIPLELLSLQNTVYMKNERGWYRIPPRWWFFYGKRKKQMFFFSCVAFLRVFASEFLLFFFNISFSMTSELDRQLRVIKIFAQSLCSNPSTSFVRSRFSREIVCACNCVLKLLMFQPTDADWFFFSDDWQRFQKIRWLIEIRSFILPDRVLLDFDDAFFNHSVLLYWRCVLFLVMVLNYLKYALEVCRQILNHHPNHLSLKHTTLLLLAIIVFHQKSTRSRFLFRMTNNN
jgi:hypothetical protein